MKCKECNSLLLNIYYRENKDHERTWIKIKKGKYCKVCKNLVVR